MDVFGTLSKLESADCFCLLMIVMIIFMIIITIIITIIHHLSFIIHHTQKVEAGVTHAMMAVRALPSREDWRIRVSLLSRYPTWDVSDDLVASVEITRERTDKLRLILRASSKVSPVAPVYFTLSEPARSTRES